MWESRIVQHLTKGRGTPNMRKLLATLLTVAVAAAFVPTLSDAASSCPPEVAQAKDLLTKQTAASRTLAGARDIQAPRMQDVQAPKMQDVQAPRMQDVQAPRTLAGATQIDASKAAKLVKEAEAACKAGDMKTAKSKAAAAIARLK